MQYEQQQLHTMWYSNWMFSSATWNHVSCSNIHAAFYISSCSTFPWPLSFQYVQHEILTKSHDATLHINILFSATAMQSHVARLSILVFTYSSTCSLLWFSLAFSCFLLGTANTRNSAVKVENLTAPFWQIFEAESAACLYGQIWPQL